MTHEVNHVLQSVPSPQRRFGWPAASWDPPCDGRTSSCPFWSFLGISAEAFPLHSEAEAHQRQTEYFTLESCKKLKPKVHHVFYFASVLEMHIRVYVQQYWQCVCNICSHILQRAEHQHRAHSFRPAVRLDRIRMNPTGFECGSCIFLLQHLTLEENLRWTSASSVRLFFSWAQASPSVLREDDKAQ